MKGAQSTRIGLKFPGLA